MSEPTNVVEFPTKAKKEGGNFFAIDRRAWRFVCDMGLNEAVAYLVLANGTGGDNRTTKWSEKALREYGGLGRLRAKQAIQRLEKMKVVKVLKAGAFPMRYLQPAHEIPGCEGFPPGEASSTAEKALLADLTPRAYVSKARKAAADALVRKGLARWVEGGQSLDLVQHNPEDASKPDWIWLPRALVEGADDEVPPVELLHQAQDVALLRLFIDLYHAHVLWENGGVDPTAIYTRYDRERIGDAEGFVVWAFKYQTQTVHGTPPFTAPFMTGEYRQVKSGDDTHSRDIGWDAFFEAIGTLERLGLLGFVPHLYTSDTATGEMMHPLSMRGKMELPEEAILTMAAYRASLAILPAHLRDKHVNKWMVPVAAHIKSVAARGVLRLRYRPQTNATAEWMSLAEEWMTWTRRYEALKARADEGQSLSMHLQHQG